MRTDGTPITRRLSLAALLVSSAVALGACQQKSASLEGIDPMTTGSTQPASYQEASELGRKWQADRGNIQIGLSYAAALEKLGQKPQQIEVLKSLSESHPANTTIRVHLGKSLLASGRAGEAAATLERAIADGDTDWRTHSALGSAYDQKGQYAEARVQYSKALAIKPGSLAVINNMGMSYAIEGNLTEAEKTFRNAMDMPGARDEPRIRQNLALVVGLQGRFEESRKIASEDLPPAEVEANMAYLQKMLAQPNPWKELSGGTPG